MSATTESAMFGNTSNPWKQGYSAGGSTGGGQAAVTAGIVPIAHGSDIGGSIRIPASWCGGVGLKPSRMRVSIGPVVDEGGWGYSMNFVQAKTVRDAAAMLDCVSNPQPGDPFIIPKPDEAYAALAAKAPRQAQDRHRARRAGRREGRSRSRDGGRGDGQGAGRHGPHRRAGKRRHGRREARWRRCIDLFFFAFDARARRLRQAQRPQARPRYARAGDLLASTRQAKDITPARFIAAIGCRQHRAPQARRVLHQVRHLALADHVAACPSPGATTISPSRA